MLEIYLAALGALALALGLTSRALRHLPVTEPLAALMLGIVLSPAALGIVDAAIADAALPAVSEISLALAVMAVALRHPLSEIRDQVFPLALLLTVVLVGMAVVSGVLGLFVLGLGVPAAAVLGATLAPTDPVLAASVVAGEPAQRDLPARLRVLVSVESGANDGLAFALVAVAIAGATGAALTTEAGRAALAALLAAGLGGALGWLAGRLLVWSDRHREIEHSAFLMLTVVLTLCVLGVVKIAGGAGVLAVLVAGLVYDQQISTSERHEEWEAQEAINRYLILPVFTLFGVALPWADWAGLGWAGIAFAAAVLVLRRLPLVLVLRRGLRLGLAESAFAGWFGPVGVAAIFYLTQARDAAVADSTLWAAGTLVVVASTVAHGITAAPGRAWFARRQIR